MLLEDIRNVDDVKKIIGLKLASSKVLVLTNILTIVLAILLQMDPSSVVWAYWLESIVIGMFTVLALIWMSGKSMLLGERKDGISALGMSVFFCVHYGFFHAMYAVFLYILPWFTPDFSSLQDILILVGVLVLSHAFSFIKNMLQMPGRMENTKENRNRFMMAPYERILPMHMAILLSGFVLMPLVAVVSLVEVSGWAVWLIKMGGLVIFMVIKTLADLFGHAFMHKKG